jgi:hypothetical protein
VALHLAVWTRSVRFIPNRLNRFELFLTNVALVIVCWHGSIIHSVEPVGNDPTPLRALPLELRFQIGYSRPNVP